jgi:uncharacterized protein YfbU (UPF0304 family)
LIKNEVIPDTVFSCKSYGRFVKDDVFCEKNGKYQFRCKNNENCNSVAPLSEEGWKMWETWELLPNPP